MTSTAVHLSKKDRSFLALAVKIAEQSSCDTRHGAVIVKGGSVLAVGWNKNKNHPTVFGEGSILCASVHAEMDALSKVSDAKGATMYIARLNKRGVPMMSKPCESCSEGLDRAGIRRVVHTA